MPKIIVLASQYELLEATASYLSTLDLLNLAFTCSELYTHIRKSEVIFDRLKRVALCDGRGLKLRQGYRKLYELHQQNPEWGAEFDEEIEVRAWNLKCDAENALPCLGCGVNICEECRYMPRVRDGWMGLSCRWPHINDWGHCHAIRCYCKECDQDIERNLPLRLLEFCDCDQYKRWICMKCKIVENNEWAQYLKTRTKGEYQYPTVGDDGVRDDGMWITSHQEDLAFWCPCGKRSPSDGNIRCGWCFRRHAGTKDTFMSRYDHSIPFFDEDPCHPRIAWDAHGERIMYPDLGYTGPIAP